MIKIFGIILLSLLYGCGMANGSNPFQMRKDNQLLCIGIIEKFTGCDALYCTDGRIYAHKCNKRGVEL